MLIYCKISVGIIMRQIHDFSARCPLWFTVGLVTCERGQCGHCAKHWVWWYPPRCKWISMWTKSVRSLWKCRKENKNEVCMKCPLHLCKKMFFLVHQKVSRTVSLLKKTFCCGVQFYCECTSTEKMRLWVQYCVHLQKACGARCI